MNVLPKRKRKRQRQTGNLQANRSTRSNASTDTTTSTTTTSSTTTTTNIARAVPATTSATMTSSIPSPSLVSTLPLDPTQWGMDPLYWSYVHITCHQVGTLETLPSLDHAHVLNQRHSLSKVELVGVVVRVVDLEKMNKYTLDDGTGMVDCTQWKTREVQKLAIRPPSFCLGDTIRVRGKLKMIPSQSLEKYLCFGIREVSVQSLLRVESVHEEIYHRLQCTQLHHQFYSGTQDESMRSS